MNPFGDKSLLDDIFIK